jgi:diadenosine tetraphosphatase ApaH/serine/threonine PP2A family protein phosphatase
MIKAHLANKVLELSNKALELANRAIANPELLNELPQDQHANFVLGVAVYHKDLAIKLDEIRQITNPSTRILFWEAVGILTGQEDYS